MDKFLCLLLIVFCVSSTSSLYAQGPTRINNGFPAIDYQFPYMISLQQLSLIHTPTRGHKCGGALVTLRHAVTSAFCVLDFERVTAQQPVPIMLPAEYRVFAGSAFLSNDTSTNRIRRIASFTAHPQYNRTNIGLANNRFNYDIAVITLGTPFLNTIVATLPIGDIGVNSLTCIFTGWGSGTQLHFAQMTAMNEATCRPYLPGNTILSSSMVCGIDTTTGPEAKPTWGDDGSPLVCNGNLLGILIDINGFLFPDLYTRVANYTTWINYVAAQPVPDLGNETSTQAPTTTSTVTTPVTLPVTLPVITTTPSPGGASTFQPGMAVLAVVAIAQILSVNVFNKDV